MIKLSQVKTKRLLMVHGWSGMVLGLLLYVVIVTGAVAVMASEIGRWAVGGAASAFPMTTGVQERLDALASTVEPQYLDEISIFGNSAGHLVYFFHTHGANGAGEPDDIGRMLEFDPATGDLLRDRSGFGEDLFGADPESALDAFLVDLHVNLHIPNPWGVYITGILGFIMLLAAGTGLLAHRHVLKDLFVPPRYSSALLHKRDRHILAGSWALPFAFVLAFTGAFYSFAIALGFPVVTKSAFGGDRMAMVSALVGAVEEADATPQAGVNLDALLQISEQRAGAPPLSAIISHFGRADSKVTVYHAPRAGHLAAQSFIFDGVTGAFEQDKPVVGLRPSASSVGYTLMSRLHFGNFAGLLSKFVWVSLGFAMAYVTLSGMRLWIERRADSPLWQGFGTVLSVVGYGLPLALIGSAWGFFLSLSSQTSQLWTPASFLIACTLIISAGICGRSTQRLKERFVLALGIALIATPILRFLTVGGGWGIESGFDHIVVMMDLLMLITGLACVKSALQMEFLSGIGSADETVPAE
ncbi:MAG: PepSY-associated TM helix domain-containing protein [Pseudomonadota bacterium]